MSYLFVQILYLMHSQYTVCKSSKISDKQILREIVFYFFIYLFFFEIDTKYTCDKNFVKVTFLIRKGVTWIDLQFTVNMLNSRNFFLTIKRVMCSHCEFWICVTLPIWVKIKNENGNYMRIDFTKNFLFYHTVHS